jgi:beta-lactamase class A
MPDGFRSTINETAMNKLDAQVRTEIAGFEGRVSLLAQNLDTGASYGLGEDTRVQTASTIKLGILAAIYAEVAAGRAAWDDPLLLTDAKKVGGAGVLSELGEGLRLTLRDAARLMMILSDNTATNLALDRITIDAVNDFLDTLGITEIRSLNKIGGGATSRALLDPENKGFGLGVATPRAMVYLLAKLERGEVVSTEASQEMLSLLKHQYPYTGIGRRRPEIDRACKSGALDSLRSEVGILYTDDGPIAIAITCDQMPHPFWSVDNPGMLMLSRLSEILCQGLAATKENP